jgi:hypothetical protein
MTAARLALCQNLADLDYVGGRALPENSNPLGAGGEEGCIGRRCDLLAIVI